MEIILIILLVFASLLLIGAVLIQPGKGDMLSGMGGVSTQFNSALGTKNATNFLSKSTWGLAAFLVVGTIIVNLMYSGSNTSVKQVEKSATENVKTNFTPAPVSTTPFQETPPATENAPVKEENKEEQPAE